MNIIIKENKKPIIKKIKFECDVELHKRLNEFELTKNHLNKYNTTVFVGTQGSGKTSLMINLVKGLYKKVFHKIYVFMPKNSRMSLHDNIFDKYLDPSQLYEELDSESINEVYQSIKNNSEENLKSIIIFDDVQRALKDTSVLLSLKNLIANQRHLKLVNFILVQNYFSMDKSLRELLNNVILFKLGKAQTEKVFNECIENKKEIFDEVRDIVFNEPYQWLFLNINTQKMYKQFDELIINID